MIAWMESPLYGSENEIEDENQLNLLEPIDSLTTSSNLKKIKTKKNREIHKKKMFWKNLKKC